MATDPSITDLVSRRKFLAGVGVVGVSGLAGCGGADGSGDSDLEGTIEGDGSNTVFPLTDALGEAFEDEHPDVQVNVAGSGTGAGFSEFTQGSTDLQNASREIDEEEQAAADENDIEFTQFEVGQDGLAVLRHNDNDWADCLTVEQLGEIWEFESDVETWSDVDPEWPDEEIELYGRDDASGTFDYFTEAVTGEAGNVRDDYEATSDTNVIIDGVSQSEYALGFGGVNYYNENEDALQLVGVESPEDGECYEPTDENIESGAYQPLTRPLYVFVNNESAEREEVEEFLRFYFDNVTEIAPDVGFYGAPEDVLDENRQQLDEITGGNGDEENGDDDESDE